MEGVAVRLPITAHEEHPWRIRQIAPDFTVEDVWALPAHGRAEDFAALVELVGRSDPGGSLPLPARALWWARERLGRWLDDDRASTPGTLGHHDTRVIPGTDETTLLDRLPDDLRGTVDHLAPGALPFTPLYLTGDEFAAELSNRTVHAVMHLAWVDLGGGDHAGRMAVYVKPRGRLGAAYMTVIKPFRYAIVYPALMRHVARTWADRRPTAQP